MEEKCPADYLKDNGYRLTNVCLNCGYRDDDSGIEDMWCNRFLAYVEPNGICDVYERN